MRTRRSVLSLGAGALAGVAGIPAWGRPENQPGRAVVSVWLAGGDDSNNMVVPLDGRFESYSRARGELSIEAGRLAVLARTGASAGLHPSLASLVPIFEAGDLSIALNAGDLALRPSAMHHDYNFLEFMADGYTIPKWAAAIDPRIVEERRPHLKLAGGGAAVGKARRLEAVRPAGPEFPHTRIGRDLGNALGVIIGGLEGATSPLVVQVVHSGFDTHRDQLAKQAALYQELADAVAVFWEHCGRVRAARQGDALHRDRVQPEPHAERARWIGTRLGRPRAYAGWSLCRRSTAWRIPIDGDRRQGRREWTGDMAAGDGAGRSDRGHREVGGSRERRGMKVAQRLSEVTHESFRGDCRAGTDAGAGRCGLPIRA